MKIEVWSDFVCPFCYIGKRNMEEALEKSGMKDQVEIVYKSFQLNPEAKKHYDESIDEIIAKKYGMSIEQAQLNNQKIIQAAKNVGLLYNFKDIKPTNTFDAHRLSHFAKEEGKMDEFTEIMMKKYFIESANISDEDVLLNVIDQIGLDKIKAKEVLDSTRYSEDIKSDIEESSHFGIGGVPFFIFDRKTALSGAQPVEAFIETINKLNEETKDIRGELR